MAETEIRLHLDESVTLAVAAPLRARGISVTTSAETDLIGASDEQQLAFATSEGRNNTAEDENVPKSNALRKTRQAKGNCE
jgi:hypothetical protein